MNQYIDDDSNNIDLILERKFRGDGRDYYLHNKEEEFDWQLYEFIVGHKDE